MSWLTGGSRAHRADRLEDLASALDAGLGPRAALDAAFHRSGDDVDEGVAAALRAALPQLDAASLAALAAAETAGELPDALREAAASERATLTLWRDVGRRVAYPILLIALATATAVWLAALGQPGGTPGAIAVWLAVLAALVGAGVLIARRARRDPGVDPTRWPLIGVVAQDATAIPYLSALRRLHRAGVRLDEAHRLATGAAPLASTRARPSPRPARGLAARAPLVESLRLARALDDETLQLLTAGERSGDLEGALARATERRRARLDLGVRRLARIVGGVVYVVAVLLVVRVVFGFYGGLLRRY